MSARWREHALLKGRFHADVPDDIQVVMHDGGPRTAPGISPELMWVRVCAAGPDANTFSGDLLNEPTALKTVRMGARVLFRAHATAPHPFRITEMYQREIANWRIHPCQKCGFDELWDPPSRLISAVFPNLPEDSVLEGFTALCPWCGGAQGVESIASTAFSESAQEPVPPRWWEFWK